MSKSTDPVARFWSHVDRSSGPDGCWPWMAARIGGYGALKRAGKMLKAHRVAYELAYGPIPAGLCVLHHCDNPPCVNPAHLWLGTQQDNTADRNAKGRQATGDHVPYAARRRGSRHPDARLTEAQIVDIRLARADGFSLSVLGAKYGVSKQAIARIATGRTWRHVLRVTPAMVDDGSALALVERAIA